MSDFNVVEWMAKIQKSVWDAMGETAPDVVDVIGIRAEAILNSRKPAFWGNPRQSGRIQAALRGQDNFTDSFSKTESEITAEREINLPFAYPLEYGGSSKVNPAMAGVFYKLYELTKDKKYKWAYVSAKNGWKSEFKRNAHPFVAPAYDAVNEETLTRLLEPYLTKELNKIPNLEVIIGN